MASSQQLFLLVDLTLDIYDSIWSLVSDIDPWGKIERIANLEKENERPAHYLRTSSSFEDMVLYIDTNSSQITNSSPFTARN